jgi:site-specific recombinase XerD
MSDTAKQKQAPLPIPPTGTAFSLVVGQYLDDMEARRQPNTYAYKKATINRFLIHMGGDFLLGDLTISDIDTYMLNRRQEDGPKAANRDAIELKACLNWAIRKNLWQSNPFREVEPFPEQKFQ